LLFGQGVCQFPYQWRSLVCHFVRVFEGVDSRLANFRCAAALGVIEGLPIGSVVAGNRHNLLDGTAGLGQGLGCVLAQAVRGKFLGSPDTL
jgi:hypothetical protein